MSNQAAWIPAPKTKPLKVDTAPYPEPAADEVVIKNAAVAINPIDWKIQEGYGSFLKDSEYPAIVGHNTAGEIVQVGSEVTDLAVGQRVIAHCLTLATHQFKHSGFQLYVAAPSKAVASIPSSLSFTQAVVLPLAISTASAGLYLPDYLALPFPSATSPGPDKNKTILIWGASSSVGCVAVQLATASGLTVFATASPRNFDLVKSLGAAQVFDYSKPDVVNDIIDALKGTELVGAYDIVGSPVTVKKSAEVVKAIRSEGFVASTLPPPKDLPDGITSKYVFAPVIFQGNSEVGKAIWSKFVPEALENDRLQAKPDPFVVGKGLEKIQEAFNLQKEGVSAKKIVVEL